MRRFANPLILFALLIGFLPASAGAEPLPIVHQETIQAGPYTVAVGFSDWPLRAERSFDVTFSPDGGIADKRATLTLTPPEGEAEAWSAPLGRHPRQRELWGIDLIALPEPGPWSIGIVIEGPRGEGSGVLPGVVVEARPGPPALPFWLLAILPLLFLGWLIARGWRADRPAAANPVDAAA